MESQKAKDPQALELDYGNPPRGCWELNLGPPGAQAILLATKPHSSYF